MSQAISHCFIGACAFAQMNNRFHNLRVNFTFYFRNRQYIVQRGLPKQGCICDCFIFYNHKLKKVNLFLFVFVILGTYLKYEELKLSLLYSPFFSAIHLYVPFISFVTFGRRSWYPSSVFFSIAGEGRFPSLNFQVIVGFGKPVALQRNLAVFPSGTFCFLGDTKI